MRSILLFLLTAGLSFSKSSINAVFSSSGSPTEAIVQVIEGSKSSIHLAAYSFTSKPIAEALVNAHRRGVQIKAVLDKSNDTAKYSSARFLANQGIPTRINSRYAIMHNKFMIVDGKTVETGSFNYTKAAEAKNAENILILRDVVEIARQYEQEWQELWDEGHEQKRPVE